MDIFAHGLWAGAAAMVMAPRLRPPRKVWAWTVCLAVLPDLGHLLPVTGWALASYSSGDWWRYATALPGQEPPMPSTVVFWAHHLHCVLHSALSAAAVTALVWLRWRRFWLPLIGWWLHIVIDVFTHSAEFFPSPVLYPLTYWGFDGWAWNQPIALLFNYAALALVWGWLLRARCRLRG